VFRRLTESEEWKKELDENLWLSDFLTSAEARKQMDRDDVQLRAFLRELALIK
jgi:tripartite-type tricarboxylate transporter receptor subunit TctC